MQITRFNNYRTKPPRSSLLSGKFQCVDMSMEAPTYNKCDVQGVKPQKSLYRLTKTNGRFNWLQRPRNAYIPYMMLTRFWISALPQEIKRRYSPAHLHMLSTVL
ncbi:hypothetical protein KQX54_019823 [Cotesia glomerata]|uniref:Uncharacterized protein n=1 Tax=Cotesia glomerata TaxID=32391 RepID=A0AAV7HW00_COTGL|nr:hypothetical protein KQX54_019823 [Cotesia glomerata]